MGVGVNDTPADPLGDRDRDRSSQYVPSRTVETLEPKSARSAGVGIVQPSGKPCSRSYSVGVSRRATQDVL
jgi:hypothetical protein